MSGRTLLHIIAFAALAIGEVIAWITFRRLGGETGPYSSALLLHAGVAAGAALAGSTWLRSASLATRATLGLFFFTIAAVLPVAGILAVGAFAWIFALPAGDGLRPEDRYEFDNPEAISARRESRNADPELRPLAESMRSLSLAELEHMVHGLKFLSPHRQSLHFLRRFQTDPHSNLQFAAQGVITGAVEGFEAQLKTLAARLKEDPRHVETHLACAEVLMGLASWTPEGDATADVYRQDAMEHLREAQALDPDNARILSLQAQCNLALNKPDTTRVCARRLRGLQGETDFTRLMDLQALFLDGNWAALPPLAAQIQDAPPDFSESLAFWTKPVPKRQQPRL